MSLSDYLNQVLEEGARDRYLQLFQNLKLPSDYVDQINTVVDWARQNLKRDDRIIWYLRWYRIAILGELSGSKSGLPPEEVERFKAAETKAIAEMAQKTHASPGAIITAAISIKQSRNVVINHIISTFNIPTVNAHVWGWELPPKLFADLEALENEWNAAREEEKKMLPPTEDSYDGAHEVITFPDGFAWWNLDVAYCRKEGDAMGHCGNSASYKSGDQILSLRKRVKSTDGKAGDIPYLTFILDGNGMLGEMKGRSNAKPAARYHKYILALLRNPIISGIKGGGYAPENNFKLSDLDEHDREELLADKPELAGPLELYQKEGWSARVSQAVEDALSARGIETRDFEQVSDGTIRVATFTMRDLAHMDYTLETVCDILDGSIMSDIKTDSVDPTTVKDILELLDVESLKLLAQAAGSLVTISEPPARSEIRDLTNDVITTERTKEMLIQAASSFESRGLDEESLHRFIHIITTYGFSYAPFTGWSVFDNDIMNGTHQVQVSTEDLVEAAGEAEQDDYYGEGLDIYNIAAEGWYSLRDDWSYSWSYDLDADDKELYKRVVDSTKALREMKSGYVDADSTADRLMQILRRTERPGPDQMDDLFDTDRLQTLAGVKG